MSSKTPSLTTPITFSKPLPPPHRRRDKPQLSCTLCRKRKWVYSFAFQSGRLLILLEHRLKCDRGHPCDTCLKRGLSLSCTYIISSTNSRISTGQNQSRPPAYLKLQERIDQLQDLVVSQLKGSDEYRAESSHVDEYLPSLISSNSDQEGSSQAPLTRVGHISVEGAGTTWVESDHWTAILDGISELKGALEDISSTTGDDDLAIANSIGPQLLLGEQKSVKTQDVLAAIPCRSIVDRLVSQFVKEVEIAPMVLHIPTFLNEYEHFWDHQDETSIIWIGLLFAIMCLAVLHQQYGFETVSPVLNAQDGTDSGRLVQLYRTKIAQCLVLGNYTKPSRYAVETLLLYMHVEHFRSKDTETGLWILLGITLRLALRMGYHRDGSDFSQISPFHAEMRRRVWCILFMMDAGAAAQFGLPRMVQVTQSNTAEPRNLLDEDIQEDMCELPSARPESVHTPVQYFVAKNRLISVFGKISDLKTLTEPPDYADVLKLDTSLQSVYNSIPGPLVMRSMTKAILDSPAMIMQRVYVALIFFKAKCILHRTYLISNRTDQRYMYSRTACVEAALQILQIQQILDHETQAGGRLYDDRGKVSSPIRNDFLLATIILSVDVNRAIITGSTTTMLHIGKADVESSEKVMAALRNAHLIWLRSCDSSREARQAVRAIEVMLAKTQKAGASSSFLWERATVDSLSANDDPNLALDAMLINPNLVLFAEPQGTDIDAFLDLSPLDLEMPSNEFFG